MKDSRVLFAGYKMPHREFCRASFPVLGPSSWSRALRSHVVYAAALEHLIRLRIQTKDETTPMEVLNDAVNALILEVNKMEDQFADQVEEYNRQNPPDENM